MKYPSGIFSYTAELFHNKYDVFCFKELEDATCCMNSACCCAGKCCQIPDELAIGLAIFGEILSSIDLATDWLLMAAFLNDSIKDAYTWGLLSILIVSSLFYLWELYIFILFVKIRTHCCGEEEREERQNTISYEYKQSNPVYEQFGPDVDNMDETGMFDDHQYTPQPYTTSSNGLWNSATSGLVAVAGQAANMIPSVVVSTADQVVNRAPAGVINAANAAPAVIRQVSNTVHQGINTGVTTATRTITKVTGNNKVTGVAAIKKKISMYREIASYMLLLLEDIPIQVFTVAFAFVLLGDMSNNGR